VEEEEDEAAEAQKEEDEGSVRIYVVGRRVQMMNINELFNHDTHD
jgi:hypothetical protein